MRTEADLQTAFRALEQIADGYGTPDFDVPTLTMSQNATRPHHPSRAGVIASSIAVAAAVVAAIVLATVVTHRSHTADHSSVATPPPSPIPTHTVQVAAPRTFDVRELWFGLRPLAGVTVSGYALMSDVQQVQLDAGDGQHWNLALSAASAQQPASLAGSQSVTVGGRPGLYGYLTNVPLDTSPTQAIGLVWEYAPGVWATVTSADENIAIARDDALTVANAVVLGHSQAVNIPIKVGKAPPGMRLQAVIAGPGGSRLTQHGTEGVHALIDFTTGDGTAFTVQFGPVTTGETYPGTLIMIGGRRSYVSDGAVVIVGAAYVTHLDSVSGTAPTSEQMLAVANSIVFASDMHDQGTWFVAKQALP